MEQGLTFLISARPNLIYSKNLKKKLWASFDICIPICIMRRKIRVGNFLICLIFFLTTKITQISLEFIVFHMCTSIIFLTWRFASRAAPLLASNNSVLKFIFKIFIFVTLKMLFVTIWFFLLFLTIIVIFFNFFNTLSAYKATHLLALFFFAKNEIHGIFL